ncbi:hypothetical protein IWQ61_010012 [Dispira simplex]|nr:hypothetical protein IWQ61_010012 [Dispira simplex]
MTPEPVSPPRTPTMRKVQSFDSPCSSAAFFGEAEANSNTASGRLSRSRSTLDGSFASTRSRRRAPRHEDDDLALAIRLSLEEAAMSRDTISSPDHSSPFAQQTPLPEKPSISSPPSSKMDTTTHCSLLNVQSTLESPSLTAIAHSANSQITPSDFAIVIPLHHHSTSNDPIEIDTNQQSPTNSSAKEDSDLTSLASEEDSSVVGTQDTEPASPSPEPRTLSTETHHDMAPRRRRLHGDTLDHTEDDEPQQLSSPPSASPPTGTRRASRRATRKPAKYTFEELVDLPLNQDSDDDDDFEVLPKRPTKRGNNNNTTTRKKSEEVISNRDSSHARASTPSPVDRDLGNDSLSSPDTPRRSTRLGAHTTRGKVAKKAETIDMDELIESGVTKSSTGKRNTAGSKKRKVVDSEVEEDGAAGSHLSNTETKVTSAKYATNEPEFNPESESSDDYDQEEEERTEAEFVSSEDEYIAEPVAKPKAPATGKRTLSQTKTTTTTPARPIGARSTKKKSLTGSPNLSPSTTRPTVVRKRPANGTGGNLSSLLQNSSSPRATGLAKRVAKPTTPGNTNTALGGLTATPLRRVGLSRKRPAGPKLHAYLFNQTP